MFFALIIFPAARECKFSAAGCKTDANRIQCKKSETEGTLNMDRYSLIIGNLSSLLAMGTDALSSAQKTTKRVLWVQNLSQLIYCIGAFLLGGYSGCVQNVVSIIRNIVAIKQVSKKWIEWTLTALGVVLGLVFNTIGWVGLLPVIANLQYTLVVFRFKRNERALKISFLASALMFSVFSGAILNIVGVFTNLIVAVTTTVFLIKSKTRVS